MNKIVCFISFLMGVSMYAQIQIPPLVKKGIDKAIVKNKALQNKQLDNKKNILKQEGIKNMYLPKVALNGVYAYMTGTVNVDLPTKVIPLPPPLKPISLFGSDASFETSSQAFHTAITVKSVLFSGFQIPNAKKAFQKKIEGTNYLIEAGKDKIIQEVIGSFDQLMLLKKAKELIKNSQKRLDKEQLRVKKAIDVGLAIPYDSDKIELAKLELDSKKISVEGNENVLIEKIIFLTGLTSDEIKTVQFELTPAGLLNETHTANNRKELKALEAFRDAKEYVVKKERGGYLPKIGMFMGVNYSGMFNNELKTPTLPLLNRKLTLKLDNLTMQPMFMAGVGLKWTIFDGLERNHKLETAKIEKLQIENKLSDTKEKLNLLLKNTRSKYNTENAKLNVAYQQEKIAQNNLKTAQKQYKLGLIGITERLASENEFLKAKMNTVKSLVNQRLSAVNMFMASGELSQNIQTK